MGEWCVLHAAEKLHVRGTLPGAFGFDRGAHGVRVARAKGVPWEALVPLAMPASWMVNNRAPSTVFRRWLAEQTPTWVALCEALDGGTDAWLTKSRTERDAVMALARSLCAPGHGLCALSKVLAVLCPQTVPLLDDAAVHFALGAVEMPATADQPRAPIELLEPMLDWFAEHVGKHEDALIELARAYPFAALDAAQVFDRLLWVESWGWRNVGALDTPMPRFWWLAEGAREGIVLLEGPHPGFATGARVVLDTVADEAWRARARAALDEDGAWQTTRTT